MAWTPNVRIPDQQSKASPALAYYGGLHMVHLGDSSNDIWHSYYDGQTWRRPDTGEPGNSPIPGQASKAAPAIFTNNGLLHMVHLGDSSNDIWHSTFDKTKTKWSSDVRIPGQQSKASPALTEYSGLLHMVHLGDSSNDIWHSYFDGQTWRRPDTGEPGNSRIPGQQSKAAPAIFQVGGLLHMVHLGDSSNDIWHSTFDGNNWSTNRPIPGQQSKASPALALYNTRLHMVHLGDSSNDIWHSYFDGQTWRRPDTGEPGNSPIPGQQSKASPALAYGGSVGAQLHMVHLGDSSNDIWHSISDGS